jgi:K(+)-stimulated pyrophosphate-energized sodium pump
VAGFFWFLVGNGNLTPDKNLAKLLNPLIGFAFGSSLISIFARLGGGIFTKGADVGADLVGKVEAGIPEDDPRNPAVIADNVGDNVGRLRRHGRRPVRDLRGDADRHHGAGRPDGGRRADAGGAVPAGAGRRVHHRLHHRLLLRQGQPGHEERDAGALQGLAIAGVLSLIAFWFVTAWIMPDNAITASGSQMRLFGACAVGLVLTAALVWITEFYTGTQYSPVKHIAQASTTGHGTNIIAGLGVSMRSTAWPVLFVCVAIMAAYTWPACTASPWPPPPC